MFYNGKLHRLRVKQKKSLTHQGVQTEDLVDDILKFPRSTQTDNFVEQISSFTQTDVFNFREGDSQTDSTASADDKATQTMCGFGTTDTESPTSEVPNENYEEITEEVICQVVDAQTQTQEPPAAAALENTDATTNISAIFKSIQDRERSPFAATLTTVSTMATPSSLLFPSMISHALRAGAGAGTSFNLKLPFRPVAAFCSETFVVDFIILRWTRLILLAMSFETICRLSCIPFDLGLSKFCTSVAHVNCIWLKYCFILLIFAG